MQRFGFWQFPPPPQGPIRDPRELLPWMGVEDPFSLGDLIKAGSLDVRLAALLWALLARRATLIVAAGPRLAGKSTTLGALLEMTPPPTEFYPIAGTFSRRELVAAIPRPDDAYLVVNEISEHIPGRYLWGEGVRDLFRAREEGYAFAATLHADSPGEIIEILAEPPLRIPPEQLALMNVIVILRHGYGMRRGVESVTLLDGPRGDGHVVARWDPERQIFRHPGRPEVAEVLQRHVGLRSPVVADELVAREEHLTRLVATPPTGGWRAVLGRYP